ncbi:MAG: hypothetical protein R6V35_02095 [Candidatus Nanohaloarchaea archaeon]
MRKALLVSTVFLLMIGTVSAFEVSVNSLEQTATTDQPAVFEIEVENTGSTESDYRLNMQDYHRSQWYSYDERINIQPGETRAFALEVSPGNQAVQDRYNADFSVRESATDQVFQGSLNYRVTRDRELNLESFSTDISEVKPGEEVEASATVRNVGPSTLQDPEITFNGLNQSKVSDLGPITGGGTRSVTETFEIKQFESPGVKEIILEVEDRTYTEEVEVEEIENISEKVETDNRVFVVNKEYRFENDGNTQRNYTYEVKVPDYLAPVTYTEDAERFSSENGTGYRWTMNLEPGETETIETRTDYWIPITGLAVLFVSFIVLRKITSSVSVVKKVEERGDKVIITLEVENSSSKTYDDVLLEDYVPNIASVSSNFDMATPEIVNEEEGTKLKWWITDLGPGDQRILKYTLRPKVEVEGGVTLDPAELKDGDETLSLTDQVKARF